MPPQTIPRCPASPLFVFTQEISPSTPFHFAMTKRKPPTHCPVPVDSGWHHYYSHMAEAYLDAFPWIRRAPRLERAQSFVVFCADELPQVVLFRDSLGHEVVYYVSKGRVLVEGCQCPKECPFARPKPSYASIVKK